MPGASRRNNDNANSWSAISRDYSEIEKEFLLPSARVSDTKLQEIPKEDNVSLIVDYVREEILQSVGDTIYEGYLRKAVYSFVTKCAYEAWMCAFRVIYKNINDTIWSEIIYETSHKILRHITCS